jgi:RHS repeat-associated protein
VIWMKDQAGNITELEHDKAGRETMRTFSTIASGTNNVEDLSTLINWINNIVWDARWDLNADGSVTTADYACYPERTLGRGKLSWVNNRIGYAGYQHAPELAGTKWHVRHRALDAERGEWLTRDRAGFIDGKNLYQYARSRPLVGVDPMGLFANAPSTGLALQTGCGSSTGALAFVPRCGGGGAPPQPEDPLQPAEPIPCSPCATFECCEECCTQSYPNDLWLRNNCMRRCDNRVDPPPDPGHGCGPSPGTPTDCWHQSPINCASCCRQAVQHETDWWKCWIEFHWSECVQNCGPRFELECQLDCAREWEPRRDGWDEDHGARLRNCLIACPFAPIRPVTPNHPGQIASQ